jgi:hypothetical protein
MVQVIKGKAIDHCSGTREVEGWGGGAPLIHVHHIERHVHGNAIALKVYGEMKIAAGEYVFARELKLKTIEVLTLTPEVPPHDIAAAARVSYKAQKYIYHKGEYNNFASIDIFGAADAWQGAGTGPTDGSTWLDFIAEGE